MNLIWLKKQLASGGLESPHALVISEVTQYQRAAYLSPFSVKMVLRGEEQYKINQQHISIKAQQYYLANAQDEVSIDFRTDKPALGICLQPPIKMLNEAFQFHLHPSKVDPIDPKEQLSFSCIDRVYRIGDDELGQYLDKIGQFFRHKKNWEKVDFDLETLYLELALRVVCSQLRVQQVLRTLPAQKRSTQLEVYKRVARLRDYIEANFSETLNSDDFSKIACLSKYHLIRSFKQCFSKSPHQYLLDRRLEEGLKLRQSGQYTYLEIAGMIGYSDHTNLRKALKRKRQKSNFYPPQTES